MSPNEHRQEAERLLSEAVAWDREWAPSDLVVVTAALAHATLAGIREVSA